MNAGGFSKCMKYKLLQLRQTVYVPNRAEKGPHFSHPKCCTECDVYNIKAVPHTRPPPGPSRNNICISTKSTYLPKWKASYAPRRGRLPQVLRRNYVRTSESERRDPHCPHPHREGEREDFGLRIGLRIALPNPFHPFHPSIHHLTLLDYLTTS